MGWADGFAQGVQLGRSLVATYQDAKQRKELEEIQAAKPEDVEQPVETMEGFTGAAPDASGATSQMDLADAPMRMVKTGATRFLGKTYDKPLTEQQIMDARTLASGGVLMKTNPLEGARLVQSVQQGQREGERFEREKTVWGQQDKDRAKAEDYERSRSEAFSNTYYGRATAEYAQQLQQWSAAQKDYQAKVAAGADPATLGAPPERPQRQAYTVAQSLADEAMLLANDAKHSRLDTAAFAKFTERVRAVEQEGYGKALRLAQGGASLDAVAQAFNASGAERFDPKSVISDKMVKTADGVPSRQITFRTPDGQTQTINTVAELDALGQAQELFARHFKGREDARQEKELGIRGAGLAIQRAQSEASIAHLNAQTEEVKAKTEDRKELSTIREELTGAIDKGDAAAEKKARDKLLTYTLSGKGGQNVSDLERRANFLLASGLAKTPADAARLANEKVQTSPKDDFLKLTTGAMPLSGDQLESAMQIMHGADWKSKVGGSGAAAAAGGLPAPNQREVGKTYDTPRGQMIWRGTGWEPVKK